MGKTLEIYPHELSPPLTLKTNMELEKFYTIKELHESPLFPYRERRIRQLISEGKLKARKVSSQKIVIFESDILKFIKEND